MQPETRFKIRIRKHLDEIPKSWWFKVQLRALRGIPDIIGCVRGRFVALELKVEGNKADPLQGWVIKKIAAAGGYARVVYPHNMAEVLAELEGL